MKCNPKRNVTTTLATRLTIEVTFLYLLLDRQYSIKVSVHTLIRRNKHPIRLIVKYLSHDGGTSMLSFMKK